MGWRARNEGLSGGLFTQRGRTWVGERKVAGAAQHGFPPNGAELEANRVGRSLEQNLAGGELSGGFVCLARGGFRRLERTYDRSPLGQVHGQSQRLSEQACSGLKGSELSSEQFANKPAMCLPLKIFMDVPHHLVLTATPAHLSPGGCVSLNASGWVG